MSICCNELLPRCEHSNGTHYKVVIETDAAGLARLNAIAMKPNSDAIANSQGVDLTAAECRALAQMLLATAELLNE